jgi:alpha-tubulin suppressor-like RCC1 family protein
LAGIAVRRVACGDAHTLVVADDGALYTFGRNQNGAKMRAVQVVQVTGAGDGAAVSDAHKSLASLSTRVNNKNRPARARVDARRVHAAACRGPFGALAAVAVWCG